MLEEVSFDLDEYNLLYHAFRSFGDPERNDSNAYLQLDLADPGNGNGDEIAAIGRRDCADCSCRARFHPRICACSTEVGIAVIIHLYTYYTY